MIFTFHSNSVAVPSLDFDALIAVWEFVDGSIGAQKLRRSWFWRLQNLTLVGSVDLEKVQLTQGCSAQSDTAARRLGFQSHFSVGGTSGKEDLLFGGCDKKN